MERPSPTQQPLKEDAQVAENHACTRPRCKKNFTNDESLQRHIQEAHPLERDHVCGVCNDERSRKNKAFTSAWGLNRHLRDVHNIEVYGIRSNGRRGKANVGPRGEKPKTNLKGAKDSGRQMDEVRNPERLAALQAMLRSGGGDDEGGLEEVEEKDNGETDHGPDGVEQHGPQSSLLDVQVVSQANHGTSDLGQQDHSPQVASSGALQQTRHQLGAVGNPERVLYLQNLLATQGNDRVSNEAEYGQNDRQPNFGLDHTQQQGFNPPQPQYFNHTQQQGFDHTQQQGFNHPQLQGFNFPQQQGINYTQQQGFNYLQQQAFNYPQQLDFNYPQQQAFSYPQQQAFNYPQQPGFNYPQQQGFNYPQQQAFDCSQQQAFHPLQWQGLHPPQQQGCYPQAGPQRPLTVMGSLNGPTHANNELQNSWLNQPFFPLPIPPPPVYNPQNIVPYQPAQQPVPNFEHHPHQNFRNDSVLQHLQHTQPLNAAGNAEVPADRFYAQLLNAAGDPAGNGELLADPFCDPPLIAGTKPAAGNYNALADQLFAELLHASVESTDNGDVLAELFGDPPQNAGLEPAGGEAEVFANSFYHPLAFEIDPPGNDLADPFRDQPLSAGIEPADDNGDLPANPFYHPLDFEFDPPGNDLADPFRDQPLSAGIVSADINGEFPANPFNHPLDNDTDPAPDNSSEVLADPFRDPPLTAPTTNDNDLPAVPVYNHPLDIGTDPVAAGNDGEAPANPFLDQQSQRGNIWDDYFMHRVEWEDVVRELGLEGTVWSGDMEGEVLRV